MEQKHIDPYNLFDDEILNAAYQTRDEWAESDKIRDAGWEPPKGVTKIVDISYEASLTDKEAIWHTLDIYYPEEKKAEYPVIVSVHGGGWFYGTKELYRPYCMHLASLGYAVVNFNYRRSPEYRYPAAFLDVCSVMDFVYQNSNKYHFDLKKLFMVGDSAGAQLTSQYCIYATNEVYRNLIAEVCTPLYGQPPNYTNPIPKAVALNCGIYHMWDVLDQDMTKWYLPSTDDTLLLQSFTNILEYLNANFPPTYLMCSVNDPLAVHTAPMKKCLDEHQILMVYKEFGQDHAQDGHVFHLNLRSENGIICNREECDFFQNMGNA